jgi:hypothetical protein
MEGLEDSRRLLVRAIGSTLVVLLTCGTQLYGDEELKHVTRDGRLSPLLSNLGKLQRPVSTKSAMAQRYFDQGLTLIYAFNHAEAIRSFKEAARNDADLAMAYWGEALATGPNINDAATEAEREKGAYEATQRAVEHRAKASAVEQALIDALAKRFSHPSGENRDQRMQAYAQAMEKV